MSKSRNLGKIPRGRFDKLRQVLQDYGRQIMNFHPLLSGTKIDSGRAIKYSINLHR
jgi:hypothetical protein